MSDVAALPFAYDRAKLKALCARWKIAELSVFGSALRVDFRPDSDVDLLATFDPSAAWSLFDLERMEDEFAALLGRKVDLVDRSAIEAGENWIRRKSILASARRLDVAG